MRISDWSSDVCSSDLAMMPAHEGHRLARTLSWPHLLALGVGAIVGTGILTLIGVGADRAGPAEIGRASCRERGCQYVQISVVAGTLTKNKTKVHPKQTYHHIRYTRNNPVRKKQ